MRRIRDSSLDERVRAAARAQVIVEGLSDAIILTQATAKLYPEEEQVCDFVPAAGVDNVAAYIAAVTRLAPRSRSKIIGLLDQDQAGRRAMEKFKGRRQVPGTEFRELSHTAGVYIGLLVIPDELLGLVPIFKKSNKAKEAYVPMPIEFCFPEEIIMEALDQKILALADRFIEARDGELAYPMNLTDILKEKLRMINTISQIT